MFPGGRLGDANVNPQIWEKSGLMCYSIQLISRRPASGSHPDRKSPQQRFGKSVAAACAGSRSAESDGKLAPPAALSDVQSKGDKRPLLRGSRPAAFPPGSLPGDVFEVHSIGRLCQQRPPGPSGPTLGQQSVVTRRPEHDPASQADSAGSDSDDDADAAEVPTTVALRSRFSTCGSDGESL